MAPADESPTYGPPDAGGSGRSYPTMPVVGVGAVVWRAEEVLLVRRGTPPMQGRWSLPGGRQELGETVFACAAREVLEETGVEAEILALVDVVDAIRHDRDGAVEYHYTLVDLAGRWLAGEPRAGDDAADAAFHPVEALAGLDLWDETLRVIHASRRILAGREKG